jgi:adenylate cyclase
MAVVGDHVRREAVPPSLGGGGARERRLAAVAFLDVVGYSRLVEADEEGTLARWKHLRDAVIAVGVEASGGRVVERLGDGLLLEFRSTVAAVGWALDLQAGLAEERTGHQPFSLRIAVHLCEVVADGERILGDGVNIAARLQEHAEPGGVAFSAAVHEQVRSSLRYEAVDLGPLQLKNIGRTVRTFSVPATGPAKPLPAAALPSHRPSIAVLPLRSLGPHPVEPYFVEGLVHDIVASLAGFRELFVVSSGSTLGMAGGAAGPTVASQALAVRYVVTGTVSCVGERLRISVELTDTETRSVVWTDRYETPAADLFAQQDAAATRIACSLLPHLRQSELRRARRKPPGSQDAYDLVLQAMHRLYSFAPGDYDASRELLLRAVQRDPDYALAHALLAQWHVFNVGEGRSPNPKHDAEEAARIASLALEHDPSDPLALATYGHSMSFLFGDFERALDAFDRALASSPNSPVAWGLSSPTYTYLGDGPMAVARGEYALRLSPLDPYAAYYHHILCLAHYGNGTYEDAVRWGFKATAMNDRFTGGLRPLAAALVALGRVEEARRVGALVMRAEPGFGIAEFMARYPMRGDARRAEFAARMEAAGLPASRDAGAACRAEATTKEARTGA